MPDRAIHNIKPAIVAVSNDEAELSKDLLTAEEWIILDHIQVSLQPFHDATKTTILH
jgi:hypothetical protein